MTAPRVTVLGVGNDGMGDDSLGVIVVRGLQARAPRLPADLVEGGMAGMGLVRHFLESDVVLFVDAIDAKTDAGSIFRFDPDEAGVTQLRSNNIHGMGLPHLLTNARLLGARPKVTVYAVQVADVRPVDELTPPVAEAAQRVEQMVAEEILRLASGSAEAV